MIPTIWTWELLVIAGDAEITFASTITLLLTPVPGAFYPKRRFRKGRSSQNFVIVANQF
jgi:hypothetical protein